MLANTNINNSVRGPGAAPSPAKHGQSAGRNQCPQSHPPAQGRLHRPRAGPAEGPRERPVRQRTHREAVLHPPRPQQVLRDQAPAAAQRDGNLRGRPRHGHQDPDPHRLFQSGCRGALSLCGPAQLYRDPDRGHGPRCHPAAPGHPGDGGAGPAALLRSVPAAGMAGPARGLSRQPLFRAQPGGRGQDGGLRLQGDLPAGGHVPDGPAAYGKHQPAGEEAPVQPVRQGDGAPARRAEAERVRVPRGHVLLEGLPLLQMVRQGGGAEHRSGGAGDARPPAGAGRGFRRPDRPGGLPPPPRPGHGGHVQPPGRHHREL